MMDKISFEEGSIYANGYGILAKKVMLDTNLTIEAKAIYAYIVSYAGAGAVAFPGVEKMLYHLGISKERYYNHRKYLLQQGYLRIESHMNPNGRFKNNHYIIVSEPCPSFPYTVEPTTEYKDVNINSSNINSLNNNSIYTTLPACDSFISFYIEELKKQTGKNHVKVNEKQLHYINESIAELKSVGMTYEDWKEKVRDHLSNLPKSNNGSILAFFKASKRYFEWEVAMGM